VRSKVQQFLWQGSLLQIKAFTLQAWCGPEGSRKLRFPDYMTTAQDDGKVVSLTHWLLYPQEMLLVLISFSSWVDPRAIARPEGLCQWKIPMTPTGIEPVTFRIVAQHLNHCATMVPPHYYWFVIFLFHSTLNCSSCCFAEVVNTHAVPFPFKVTWIETDKRSGVMVLSCA